MRAELGPEEVGNGVKPVISPAALALSQGDTSSREQKGVSA